MKTKRCNFRGSDRYVERCIEYLYSHGGKYLLVPDTPVEICRECGMVYYDAAILKEIERHFFAIQNQTEVPDNYRHPDADQDPCAVLCSGVGFGHRLCSCLTSLIEGKTGRKTASVKRVF